MVIFKCVMESLKKKKDYFKKAKIKIVHVQWAKAHDMGTVGKAYEGKTNKLESGP